MKLSYDRATDSLYVLFIDRPGADVVEVAPGVVADLDETGAIATIIGFRLTSLMRLFQRPPLCRAGRLGL